MACQASIRKRDDDLPRSVRALLDRAVAAFERRFGRTPTLAAAAPGRVNLIGEHTDYNDGFVMPVAIDRWAVAVSDRVAAKRDAGALSTFVALDLSREHTVDLTRPLHPTVEDWINYPLGVANQFIKRGRALPDLDLLLTSSVPVGGGLSSSAAICVAVATVLEQAVDLELNGLEKARWCQAAEHEFAHVPCGIMDQTVSANAQAGNAMLLDCRSGAARHVPLPPPEHATLLVADTRVKHALTTDEYDLRRRQGEAAVEFIRLQGHPEVRALRDVSTDLLRTFERRMDETAFRRARHVVGENARTLAAAEALATGDLAAFGALMFESHRSLRDDCEVSCAELDALVELAGEFADTGANGVFGARMTGAGFGGCTITLCRPDAVERVSRRMVEGFHTRFGVEPAVFTTTAARGAMAIRL